MTFHSSYFEFSEPDINAIPALCVNPSQVAVGLNVILLLRPETKIMIVTAVECEISCSVIFWERFISFMEPFINVVEHFINFVEGIKFR